MASSKINEILTDRIGNLSVDRAWRLRTLYCDLPCQNYRCPCGTEKNSMYGYVLLESPSTFQNLIIHYNCVLKVSRSIRRHVKALLGLVDNLQFSPSSYLPFPSAYLMKLAIDYRIITAEQVDVIWSIPVDVGYDKIQHGHLRTVLESMLRYWIPSRLQAAMIPFEIPVASCPTCLCGNKCTVDYLPAGKAWRCPTWHHPVNTCDFFVWLEKFRKK